MHGPPVDSDFWLAPDNTVCESRWEVPLPRLPGLISFFSCPTSSSLLLLKTMLLLGSFIHLPHTHTHRHTHTHTHTHKHRHTGIKHTYIQKSYATKTLCRQLPQTGSADKLFLVAIITLNDRLITASALTLPSSRSLWSGLHLESVGHLTWWSGSFRVIENRVNPNCL